MTYEHRERKGQRGITHLLRLRKEAIKRNDLRLDADTKVKRLLQFLFEIEYSEVRISLQEVA